MSRLLNWPRVGLLMITAVLMVGAPPAAAQDEAPADPPAAESTDTAEGAGDGVIESEPEKGWMATQIADVTTRWQQGGRTMWALAFIAIVGIVFTVDRLISLNRSKMAPAGLATKANQMWQEESYDDLVRMAESSQSTMGKVIAFIVEHRDAPYEHLVSGAEDLALRDFEVHTRRNHVLSAVGAIAPLLGLMGTVFGLMGAFATIGAVGSMDDPSALAGDIGKAMVTTATGLIIAVPALGLYFYFRSRTGQLASVVGDEISALMHAWFLKKKKG